LIHTVGSLSIVSVLVQGNTKACEGQYVAAIEFFTKAIQLDSTDYR